MKSLKEYYGTGSMYYNANTLYNRKGVYSDMDPKQRKALDKMAMSKFGRRFVDCSWSEQSGLRSALDKKASEEQEDVEDEITKDAAEDKERINKDVEKQEDEDSELQKKIDDEEADQEAEESEDEDFASEE